MGKHPGKTQGLAAGLSAFAVAAALGGAGAQASAEENAILKERLRTVEQRLAEVEALLAARTPATEPAPPAGTPQPPPDTVAPRTPPAALPSGELGARTDPIQATAAPDPNVVRPGDSLGEFVLPGTDTSFTIGGYTKGDFIYDLGGSIGSDDLFVASSIAIGGENDPRFTAHARQSRLFFRTETPTDWGPLKTLFEGDFFGAAGNELVSNSAAFRIRHAWGEVGPIGAGQFWTNFMPLEAYPRTVDFQGPTGIPFIRQGQIRYTHKATDKLTVIGSLENSEFGGVADLDGDPDTAPTIFAESLPATSGIEAGIDVAPDAVLTFLYRDDWGSLRLSGVGRRFGGQDFGNGDGSGAFGWGVNTAANVKVADGTRVVASVTGGNGVGRYTIDGFAQDGFIGADGDIDAIASLGIAAQVQQKLAEDWTAALAYGRFDVFDDVDPGSIDTLQTVHASLFWQPLARVTFGAEAIYGAIQNQAGDDDDAVRLQTAIQVNF